MAGGSTAFDSSRIGVADYGMTLRFSSLQFSDQGAYECQGRSDSTQIPVRIVFNLNVQCTPCYMHLCSILKFSTVYYVETCVPLATRSRALLDRATAGPDGRPRRHGQLHVRRVRPAGAASALVHQLAAHRTGSLCE